MNDPVRSGPAQAPAAVEPQAEGVRLAGPLARSAVWLVPVLFWLYYASPLVVPGREFDLSKAMLLTLPGLVAIALLTVRKRYPVLVSLLCGVGLLFSPGVIGAAFVIQAELSRRNGRAAIVGLSAGWLTAAKLIGLLIGPNNQTWSTASTFELTLAVAGLITATLVGWLSRSRAAENRSRTDVEQARREAEEARLEQARSAERERIAREMHDVLAHRLSLVAMHSGALAFRTDLDPETTRETARLIQRNAQQSLGELRTVLSELRGSETPPEPPQPTLAELDVLIAEAREGQPVEVSGSVDPDTVPTQVSRQAHRIIQEALTNARKHAPGAPVRLAITTPQPGLLRLQISNPVAELALSDTGGSGLGLVGIGERAASVGGQCRTDIERGRFILTVTLPWQVDSATEQS